MLRRQCLSIIAIIGDREIERERERERERETDRQTDSQTGEKAYYAHKDCHRKF